ncbi:MAG: RNA polymerase sigma factor [Anaerolineae bacterium]
MIRDELEFEKIYETFRPRIHRYLTRMVGEQEAEDLTQEVFVKISRAIETFRGESQLATWIYRIATNAALDRIDSPSFQRTIQDSRGWGEMELEDQDVWTGEKAPSLETSLVRKEMSECIRDFVGGLPANYRAVLVLSDMEELPNNEIAEILGLSVNVVKIRLHRSRTRLRKEIELHCKPEEWLPEE